MAGMPPVHLILGDDEFLTERARHTIHKAAAEGEEGAAMDVPGADDPLTDESVDLVPNVDFDDD